MAGSVTHIDHCAQVALLAHPMAGVQLQQLPGQPADRFAQLAHTDPIVTVGEWLAWLSGLLGCCCNVHLSFL